MSTALVTLSNSLSSRLGMGESGQEIIETLKATAFKGGTQVTDAQMSALMIVANQYSLNPFTREIFAFPDKGGIVPVVSVDGWSRIINEHPQFDGLDFEQDAESCTCIIYRKDRSHPIKVTEWMSECRRDNAQPWRSHPKRMLRHKALIQCARLAFGFVGIYDQDEADRIIESDAPQTNKRSTPQQAVSTVQDDGYLEYEAKYLSILEEAADFGVSALTSAFNGIDTDPKKGIFWSKHSSELKKRANIADESLVTEAEAV